MPALVLKVRAFLRIKSLHDQMLAAREEAQARASDLAQLHEIGRDWSLIAEPEEFNRMVTQRLAALIGAPVCLIAVYDPATRTHVRGPARPRPGRRGGARHPVPGQARIPEPVELPHRPART